MKVPSEFCLAGSIFTMPAERGDIFAVCNSNTAPHFIPERGPIEYVDDDVFISLVRDLSACHLLVRDTAIRAYDLSMITERIHTSVTSHWRYVADYNGNVPICVYKAL